MDDTDDEVVRLACPSNLCIASNSSQRDRAALNLRLMDSDEDMGIRFIRNGNLQPSNTLAVDN